MASRQEDCSNQDGVIYAWRNRLHEGNHSGTGARSSIVAAAAEEEDVCIGCMHTRSTLETHRLCWYVLYSSTDLSLTSTSWLVCCPCCLAPSDAHVLHLVFNDVEDSDHQNNHLMTLTPCCYCCCVTFQVPSDAHVLDVVFNDGENSTFFDNNGGLDYHIPVEGGKGVMPGLKVSLTFPEGR